MAAFLYGQGMICLILAIYYAVALRLTGRNHAYSIGVLSGLISFAPYLGLLTGLVLSVGVALIQFWPSWSLVPAVLGVFVLGQAVADYVLAPRLTGERVKLSPAQSSWPSPPSAICSALLASSSRCRRRRRSE